MKATVKQIFNSIQGLNARTSTVSSLGTFVTEQARQVSEMVHREVLSNVSESSLAHKILTGSENYTEKQLWVIAYELEKNEEYSKTVAEFYARINRKENAKREASKAKLKANKEASADVLAPVKKLRKIGDFGKWLNTSGNPYRKQHFNKSYTNEAVEAFLATL